MELAARGKRGAQRSSQAGSSSRTVNEKGNAQQASKAPQPIKTDKRVGQLLAPQQSQAANSCDSTPELTTVMPPRGERGEWAAGRVEQVAECGVEGRAVWALGARSEASGA